MHRSANIRWLFRQGHPARCWALPIAGSYFLPGCVEVILQPGSEHSVEARSLEICGVRSGQRTSRVVRTIVHAVKNLVDAVRQQVIIIPDIPPTIEETCWLGYDPIASISQPVRSEK